MVLAVDRVMQPDTVFIAQERTNIIGTAINGPVDLAAEVISPADRNRDRIEKRNVYEQHGIKEYWLIDPEAQTIEVLDLENSRYQLLARAAVGEVACSKLLPGFEVSTGLLFEP